MRGFARCCAAALAALLLTGALARAADSTDAVVDNHPLSAWIDGKVGVCLEFDHLPQHWATFSAGALGTRLLQFPPLAGWRQKNREWFATLRGEFERRTGAGPQKVFTGLLGRRVLFAVWPPVDPTVDKPSALLLAETVDRELMRRTLQSFVAARKKAGHWHGVQTAEIAGDTFSIHAVGSDDEQSEFFVTSTDEVAMVATSEPLLKSVLQRRADPENEASLARSTAYLAARQHLTQRAAARVFINPRAWDLALEADLKRKQPGSEEARSQAAVVAAWAATDYVAASLQLTPRFAADVAWKWRCDDLPQPMREVAAALSGEAAFASELPSDALVAVAVHADVGRLIRQAIAQEWQKEVGHAGGKNEQGSVLVWALAAGLGPDAAGYLRAPRQQAAADDSPRLPLEGLIAVQTRSLESRPAQPALADQIEPLLHAWLSAAVTAANHRGSTQAASMKDEPSPATDGRTTVVLGVVPGYPRQELAYRVDAEDRLWAATSAALLDLTDSGKRLADDPLTAAELGRDEPPSGLAYVNLAEWRRLAAAGREAVEFLWRGKPLDERAKERQYRELLAIANLADRVWLTSHMNGSAGHISLMISADAP